MALTPTDTKRVAVLTSGGDAPGMNAAVRAAVRAGCDRGWQMVGVQRGFAGLIAGHMIPLGPRDVGGIIQRGGTMLGSARCPEFTAPDGPSLAYRAIANAGINGLIVIGGNGSQAGALALARLDVPVVGVASTIDNDLYGCEVTIGVDTALNIALEAIDRLKVTASSHQRAFLVEVMGRHCGYLALMAGLAGGAEAVLIPEVDEDPETLAVRLRAAYTAGKPHAIVVVAEGARHNAESLAAYFRDHRERLGFELRVTTLGHVQRGGTPTAFDRVLATRLAAGAIDALAERDNGVLIGWCGGRIVRLPLEEIVGKRKVLDPKLIRLADILAS
jgi:6-phosphofructokinase 1